MPKELGSQFMMTQNSGHDYEVRLTNHFEVEIDGIDSILSCSDCSPPKWSVPALEVAHYNGSVKIAGRPTLGEMSITLRDHVSPDIAGQLWSWYKQVHDPSTDKMGTPSDYKRQGTVYEYSIAGDLVRSWTCQGLWLGETPVGSQHSYEGSSVSTIPVKLNCDFASLDGGG